MGDQAGEGPWKGSDFTFLAVLEVRRLGFPGGSVVKNLPVSAGDKEDTSSTPGSGVENGNRLQYSHQGNPMDRGAWRATDHGVAESDTT